MKALSFTLLLGLFVSGMQAQKPAIEDRLHIGISMFIPYQDKNASEVISTVNDYQTSFGFQNKVTVLPGIGWQRIQKNHWFWNYAITGIFYSHQDDIVLDQLLNQGIQEPVGGFQKKQAFLYGRIEYGKLFAESEKARFIPSLSLSLDPYYQYLNIIPKTSAGFPRRAHHLGITLRAIAGVDLALSSNTQLMVKVPVGLNNLELEHHIIDNPILSTEGRKQTKIRNQPGFYDLQPMVEFNFRI